MSSRRLMLIAFHYPPIQGSSGVHRSLAFSRLLPEFGWDVTVLTVHPRAHENVRDANYRLVPEHVDVVRGQAWDAARHFSITRRYPSFLARPDRWSSWIVGGAYAGRRALGARRFDAILSTFPIASAHILGANLSRHSGLPWVADFRDPMATETYPEDVALRRRWLAIQDRVMQLAARVTVTTPGTATYYRRRYPSVDADRIVIIENGFDPDLRADDRLAAPPSPGGGRLLLLHSGVLYLRERDPTALFRALRRLVSENGFDRKSIEVRLRASGFDDQYRAQLQELGLTDVVTLMPALPYAEALEEMRSASALLLLQGKYCNDQIPAKAYEYLFAGRPILGLTDPSGDSAALLRRFGINGIAPLEDDEQILTLLRRELDRVRKGTYPVPARESVMALSRRSGAQTLARLLDAVVAESSVSKFSAATSG